MAPTIEIIDLLSSPDTASAPPKLKTTKPPPAARPNPPVRALHSDDDIFDLTGNHSNRARRLRASPSPHETVVYTGRRPFVCHPKNHAMRHLMREDDDFFLDVNAEERDDFPPARKKLRTTSGNVGRAGESSTTTACTTSKAERNFHSTVPERQPAPPATFTWGQTTGAVGWGAPGVLQPTAPRQRNATVDDPIQTSSDPFASSPRKEAGRRKNSVIDLSLVDDDEDFDIFASSPPLPKADTGKSRRSPQARRSKDHLFSSPYGGKGTAQERVSPGVTKQHMHSSPMFVSSRAPSQPASPEKKTTAKGKEKAWDHISSSAPEVGLLSDDWNMDIQLPRKSLTRSRSDGAKKEIDLGDPDTFDFDSDDGVDDDDLPDVTGLKSNKSKSTVGKSTSKVTKRTTTSKTSSVRKTPAEREAEKVEKSIAKELEKQRKQREKDKAKEKRRAEKERAALLAEVNKVKKDKKASTPEMIVDLPNSFASGFKSAIESLLSDVNATFYSHSTPVDNVVTWRRKVRARLHEEGHWEPVEECIDKESHAMVVVKAADFVNLVRGPKGSDLEAHVLKMQRHYDSHTITYLIEGLQEFMGKNANARNRQFQAAVRAAADGPQQPPPTSTQAGRKRKEPPEILDETVEAQVEDALLALQVVHHALIHHTEKPVHTAQWVKTFTEQISLIPYKRRADAIFEGTAFCMDSGQVSVGHNRRDVFVRMLAEIDRCTKSMANGIVDECGDSVGNMVRKFESDPLALAKVGKGANRDGAFSDRTVGQAMSRRICKVFLGKDENSTDI